MVISKVYQAMQLNFKMIKCIIVCRFYELSESLKALKLIVLNEKFRSSILKATMKRCG